jgi:hypothetical protein
MAMGTAKRMIPENELIGSPGVYQLHILTVYGVGEGENILQITQVHAVVALCNM